jgi:hypothetical protein
MKGLEFPRHSTTNKQIDSKHIMHMKITGFSKGMCEETKEKGYTK